MCNIACLILLAGCHGYHSTDRPSKATRYTGKLPTLSKPLKSLDSTDSYIKETWQFLVNRELVPSTRVKRSSELLSM